MDENINTPGTNHQQGTGPGQFRCKDLIEKHSGKIWVESEVEKGSVFYSSIPLKRLYLLFV